MSGTVVVGRDRRPEDRTSTADDGEPSTPGRDGAGADDWVRFRCGCGRSVAAPADSTAAEEQRCSRCREEATYADDLVRQDR